MAGEDEAFNSGGWDQTAETDPIQPIMQAAERLTRHFNGTDIDDVWPGRPEYADVLDWMSLRVEEDTKTVLSILPKGKRPVAMEFAKDRGVVQSGWTCNEHREYDQIKPIWRQWTTYYSSASLEGGFRGGGPMFSTPEDAMLELEWRYFEQWQRKVREAREIVPTAR